jgi:hypothetical protein
MALDGFVLGHIATGRALIRMGEDTENLEDDPQLWSRLYSENEHDVLAYWIERNPGSRPPAFYLFSGTDLELDEDDRAEIEILYEAGELGEAEIEVIVKRAEGLIRYNKNRDPNNPSSGFIPDDRGLVEFCIEHGLLNANTTLPLYF